MRHFLQLAAPHLHASLVSPAMWSAISALARPFPDVACMFEVRLAEAEPRMDCLLRFMPADAARRSAAIEELMSHVAASDLPTWQRLHAFHTAWQVPWSLLQRDIMATWLEFDLPTLPSGCPVPSCFCDFYRTALWPLETIQCSLELLRPAPLPAATWRQIQQCIALLPAGAQVFSIGMMFSRPFDGLRLCLAGLGAHEALSYLARIGWPGDMRQLEQDLLALSDTVGHLALALDVGDYVLPVVGVEYHIEASIRESQQLWAAFLDLLIERGHCLPARRTAALEWIGHTHERHMPEAWPEQWRAEAQAQKLLSTVLRRINHVKLVYRPDHAPEAKAYLEQMPFWLSYDAAKQRLALSEPLPPAVPPIDREKDTAA